mmetsp:Transcript_88408/g.270591  ORF Transcript_88408/g.270591 Transcript_88408/m.270591 type:complete len:352 (+) Transcript_88408:1645-2700(+)
MVDIAFQVAIIRDRAPQQKQRHVHEETKSDGRHGPPADVLRRVLQHVRPVRAAQNACEARVKQGKCSTEVPVLAVVRTPVLLKGVPIGASNVCIAPMVRRSQQPEIKGEEGVEHDHREHQPQLGHHIDAGPDGQREEREETRPDGLHVEGERSGRRGHRQGFHGAQAFQDSEHRYGQPIHNADGSANHWPQRTGNHVVRPAPAHEAPRGGDGAHGRGGAQCRTERHGHDDERLPHPGFPNDAEESEEDQHAPHVFTRRNENAAEGALLFACLVLGSRQVLVGVVPLLLQHVVDQKTGPRGELPRDRGADDVGRSPRKRSLIPTPARSVARRARTSRRNAGLHGGHAGEPWP